jgi:hypothetical protein
MQLVVSPAPNGMFTSPGGGYMSMFLTIEPTDLEDVAFIPITF